MALDLSNPQERQLALDRLAVGVGPTLGRRATAERKRITKARMSCGDTETPPAGPAILASSKHRRSLTNSRFLFLEARLAPLKHLGDLQGADLDDPETLALAQQMVDSFKAGLGDPFDLWQNPPVADDSSSDEDEWNPNGGLPYFPRRKINRRVANALTMIVTTLGQLEADQYAEERRIRAERAAKKSMERCELGPAPHRFCYVQVGDEIYLASEDGDGSLVYVAEADMVLIRYRD
ncbi:hypothetical protein B0H13DRAFT_2325204 [Mycena leptocephala]|nr:hypothetical protein B0H13DRAFT_2325204 [Mycena leptocephala]